MSQTSQKYQRRIDIYSKKHAQIEKRISQIALSRLFAFLIFLFFAISSWYDGNQKYAFIALIALATYGFFAWLHEKLYYLLPRAQMFLQVNQEALYRTQHQWEMIKDGGEWALDEDLKENPMYKELQLFGTVSLYKALNHCALYGSKKLLANRLKHGITDDSLRENTQKAALSLIAENNLRQRVLVEGKLSGLNQKEVNRFLKWINTKQQLPQWIILLAKIQPLIVLSTWIQATLTLSFDIQTAWQFFLFLQILIYAITTKALQPCYEVLVSQQHRPIQSLEHIFKLVEKKHFEDPYLQSWQKELNQNGVPSLQIQKLSKYANALAVKHSALLYGILSTLFLWELRHAYQVVVWHEKHHQQMPKLLDALYAFEFISALSFFASDHPHYTTPTLVSLSTHSFANHPQVNPIDVKGLGHPLFKPNVRRDNDFTMNFPHKLLLITGSNMSGKSSFLRALGMNLKLAQMGSVVCASAFQFVQCDLATSIQVNDDPAQGWSRYYAEVVRIKSIIERAQQEKSLPLFYLIDEMLSGTNSLERQKASRFITQQLLSAHAFGMITTHDLSLTELQSKYPNQIACGFFGDEWDAQQKQLKFDYQLQAGIATSTNALRVFEQEGITIE
jgi:DNA mismatch repair ATPase MutS